MNAERIKLFEIAIEQHVKFLVALCVLVFFVVATWAVVSWKLNDDKRQAIYDDLGEAARSIKTVASNAAEGTAEIAPTLRGLQQDEAELKVFIGEMRGHTTAITSQLEARLETLDTVLLGVRGVTDEARAQIKQNGDEATNAIASLNRAIGDTTTKVGKLFDDGSLVLETANTKVGKLLDDFDVVVVGENGLQGLVKKGNYIAAEGGEATRDVSLMTGDLYNKTHSLLFPPPEKGPMRVVKKFILRPIRTFGGAAYLVERLVYNIP